jgi:hypothetical protein
LELLVLAASTVTAAACLGNGVACLGSRSGNAEFIESIELDGKVAEVDSFAAVDGMKVRSCVTKGISSITCGEFLPGKNADLPLIEE